MPNTEPIITSLSHVVGQKRAVTVLRTALDAYWHDRPPLVLRSSDETSLVIQKRTGTELR